jgi:hypothetical protein
VASPESKVVPKVFCVGFNKTATMTLSRLFEGMGLRAAHNFRWTDWSIARDRARLDEWDAFSDGGCASIRNLDEMYPDARFILNTRPLRSWVLSRHKAVDRWVRIRNSYHAHVARFFQGRPDKLLVVDVEDACAHERIARFLGRAAPTGRPHANQDGQGTMTRSMLDAIGDQLGAGRSEEAVDAFFAKHYPDGAGEVGSVDRPALSLGWSPSDRVLRVAPFLRGPFRATYAWLCGVRSRRKSYLAKWVVDLGIRFLRSERDLNWFTTTQRFASGEK